MKGDLLLCLSEYKGSDKTEHIHFEDLLRFLKSDNEPLFSRVTPEGHVTASAFIVNKDMTKTLLTHHAKLNKWIQPGGHIEIDDKNILEAALREAKEETGISGLYPHSERIFDIDVHTIPSHPNGNQPEHKHFDVRFLFVAPVEDFIISKESHELRWFPLDEMISFPSGAVARMVGKWRILSSSLSK